MPSWYWGTIPLQPCHLSKDGKTLYRVCHIDDEKYIIPDTVEKTNPYSLYYISSSAKISVEIPSSVKVIADSSFRCNFVSDVVFKGTTPPAISSGSFYRINLFPDFKIYVPDSAVNAYKSASIFSNYADRIYPVSQKN